MKRISLLLLVLFMAGILGRQWLVNCKTRR
jgi:hypothetical protein